MTTLSISIKPASFGSVSHGTLRTQDLLSSLSSELDWQLRRNGEFFARPENFGPRNELNTLLGEASDCFGEDGETLTAEGEENGSEVVDELCNALSNYFAPMYGHFGTHEGDGADFGYWVNIENVKEQVEFVSSKRSEYPADDFEGEWLHVSDHGNATLYVRENGKDSEIWSIV